MNTDKRANQLPYPWQQRPRFDEPDDRDGLPRGLRIVCPLHPTDRVLEEFEVFWLSAESYEWQFSRPRRRSLPTMGGAPSGWKRTDDPMDYRRTSHSVRFKCPGHGDLPINWDDLVAILDHARRSCITKLRLQELIAARTRRYH